MQAIQEFFNMGGYAFYVWSSYGLSLIVLFLNVILPLRHEKQIFQAIKKRVQSSKKD
jgi:heme exporter protein D